MKARVVSAVILCSASYYGLLALVLSQFIALPFQMMVSLVYARKHIRFTWRELANALLPSVIVTLCSAVGPLLVSFWDGGFGLSHPEFLLAGFFAGCGWLAAVALTRHVILEELAIPLRTGSALAVRLLGKSAKTRNAETKGDPALDATVYRQG
jgi:hypothetical protein